MTTATQDDEDKDERPLYLQLLVPRQPKHRRAGTVAPQVSAEQASRYATKALVDEVDQLASAPEGRRNDQLNTAAFNLAQLVAGGYLEHTAAWDALYGTALAIGLSHSETQGTLRSAFTAGERQPRLVAEVHGYTPPPATVLLDPAPTLSTQEGASGEATDDAADDAAELARVIDQRFPALNWEELWADKTTDEWIAEPLLPARRLVALFSPPKMGKSLLMLEVAVCVSRGTEVLGVSVARAHTVLYVDFENDPRGDVRSRLQAMGYTPHQLENLKYLSFPQLAYLDTAMGGVELLAVARHYGAEVVVIDTISRAVQGEENDNDTWLSFYRQTGLRLKNAGIACIRLDHTGKDASKGMRGGSAKYGDVDAVWAMTQLSESTFRLECTANRLPITEKLLTVKRLTEPLRHRVDLSGVEGSARECVDALATLGVPPMATHDQIAEALEDNGITFGRNVRARAYHLRREQARAAQGITTLEDR